MIKRYDISYKKVGVDGEKSEYGNIMCRDAIVACGVTKVDALALVKVWNRYHREVFKDVRGVEREARKRVLDSHREFSGG
jgi:hypothetical protein